VDALDRTVALGMALAEVAAARHEPEQVLAALEPVAALSPNPGIDEPGFWPWQGLYADALVALDRAAEADRFLRVHEERAQARGRQSMVARLARVRGRIEAACGEREGAEAAFRRALEHVEPLGDRRGECAGRRGQQSRGARARGDRLVTPTRNLGCERRGEQLVDAGR
jgi:tetratricopeptide (TPR) repeat protein